MTFGENLKYYREKAGLNKTQLGKKMGVSAAMVRQYEKGERRNNPKYETVKKFADALGVTPADLDPDRYPVSFNSSDAFEDAWLDNGGDRHPGRHGDEAFIRHNVKKLNDAGVKILADRSGEMVNSGDYKK